MIANQFDYTAPQTLDEALTLSGTGANPLSGGMSLIPMMKLRLAAPEHLVDLARLKELSYIHEENGEIHIGATTTYYELESSPLLLGKCPLIAETATHIGDIQVRNYIKASRSESLERVAEMLIDDPEVHGAGEESVS